MRISSRCNENYIQKGSALVLAKKMLTWRDESTTSKCGVVKRGELFHRERVYAKADRQGSVLAALSGPQSE